MGRAENSVKEIAEEMVQEAIELSELEMQKLIIPSADEVRRAAQELVDYATYLQEKNSQSLLDNMNLDTEAKVLKFSTKMVQQREEFTDLMQRVLDFQNISNRFLGQQVQMTFVDINDRTGHVTLYAVDNTVEDLSLDRASKSHGGGITGRYKKNTISKVAKTIVNSKYNEQSLQSTFSEVYSRYRISKNLLRKLRGAAYILWKERGKWDGVWISGAGPLGEAYVNFFVNEYVFGSSIEKNVEDYMLNGKYGAVKADNASGLLQGDVTKGSLEFGVKINGATALGYVDIIKYAKELLEVSDVKNFLLGLKQKLESEGVGNMVKPLEHRIDEDVDQLIEALMKR